MLPPFAMKSIQVEQPGIVKKLACSDTRDPMAHALYSSAGMGSE